MDGVPYDVMIDGVSLVFSIAAVIWAARFAGWPPDRLAPLTALCLGVLLVAGYQFAPLITTVAVRGIAAGTVAAGGYAGVKKMVTNSPNPLVNGFSITGAKQGAPVRKTPGDDDQQLQP